LSVEIGTGRLLLMIAPEPCVVRQPMIRWASNGPTPGSARLLDSAQGPLTEHGELQASVTRYLSEDQLETSCSVLSSIVSAAAPPRGRHEDQDATGYQRERGPQGHHIALRTARADGAGPEQEDRDRESASGEPDVLSRLLASGPRLRMVALTLLLHPKPVGLKKPGWPEQRDQLQRHRPDRCGQRLDAVPTAHLP
jgi:hypothetical protein